MIFFAAGGRFSFGRNGDISGDASPLSGLASSGNHLGFIGYVVIPGIAYSTVLWLLVTNARLIVPQVMRMKMITLLAVLAMGSALWSQDPLRSAYNGLFYFIETLFAFYLVVKFDPEEILSLVMKTGSIALVLGLTVVFLPPHSGVVHYASGTVWKGMFGDRTMAGKCVVFLLSPALIFRRRLFTYRYVPYIALLSLMMFMAHAMTARIVLLSYVAFMALIGISRKFGKRSSLIMFGSALTAGALIIFFGFQYLPTVLESIGKNATLTGRTGIWELVIHSVAKRPLLGYGYYAFWQGLKGESANLIVATHWVFGYAHNGILEICLQLGLLGTAIFFATLIQAIRDAWTCFRARSSPGVEWYIGLVFLTILYNIDESTVLWPIDLVSILYLVACCGLAKAARQIKSTKNLEAMYN